MAVAGPPATTSQLAGRPASQLQPAPTYPAAGPVVNPVTGQPFTPADMIRSGEFTANTGLYQDRQHPAANRADQIAGMDYAAANQPKSPHEVAPDTQYLDAFNASMGTMRQGIDNALVTGMTALGARRDTAAKIVAGLPAAVKKSFSEAATKGGVISKAADKAMGTGVKYAGQGSNSNRELYAADMMSNRDAGTAAVPFLNAGVAAQYDQGATRLQGVHDQAAAQLAGQQMQFAAQQASQAQARNYQLEDRAYAEANPKQGEDPNEWYRRELFKDSLKDNGGTAAQLDPYQRGRLMQEENKQATTQGYMSADARGAATEKGQRWARELVDGTADGDRKKAIIRAVSLDGDLQNWFTTNGLSDLLK